MAVRMKALRTFLMPAEGRIPRGSEFETSEGMARGLERKMLAVRMTYQTKVITPEIKHAGGGWYELPDGSKVQGKEAAEEALKGAVDDGAEGQDDSNPGGD